jgi:hypothetical protein
VRADLGPGALREVAAANVLVGDDVAGFLKGCRMAERGAIVVGAAGSDRAGGALEEDAVGAWRGYGRRGKEESENQAHDLS